MESKEDKLLLAQIEDKIRQCSDKYMMTNSLFLDMRQRSLTEAMLRTKKGARYGFYGGYGDHRNRRRKQNQRRNQAEQK